MSLLPQWPPSYPLNYFSLKTFALALLSDGDSTWVWHSCLVASPCHSELSSSITPSLYFALLSTQPDLLNQCLPWAPPVFFMTLIFSKNGLLHLLVHLESQLIA